MQQCASHYIIKATFTLKRHQRVSIDFDKLLNLKWHLVEICVEAQLYSDEMFVYINLMCLFGFTGLEFFIGDRIPRGSYQITHP